MTCTHCGLWELAAGDLACSWCGTSYVHFTLTFNPTQLSTADYPPPVELHIHNHSPLAPITLETIQPAQSWVTPLPDQVLPPTLAPNTHHTILLDIDTFASTEPQATLTVTAQYAPQPQTAILHLHHAQPPEPGQT